MCTEDSTRACSTMVRASATMPLVAQPRWWSISKIFSMLVDSSNLDVTRFSAASTTPWVVWIPIAVDPNFFFLSDATSMLLPTSARAYLDRLRGIFDLEETSFRRKGVDATIVLALRQKHPPRPQTLLGDRRKGRGKGRLCVIQRVCIAVCIRRCATLCGGPRREDGTSRQGGAADRTSLSQ